MNPFILVVGGGKVGANLSRELLANDFEVVVIEQNPRKHAALEKEFEQAAIMGDGTEVSVLEKAGIARADYVIAVTGDDEDNIIISQLATEKYGVKNIIARVNNPSNQQTFDMLGVRPTVSSVRTILSMVEHRLPHQRLLSLLSFEEENIQVVEVILSENSVGVGKKLRDLPLPQGILLVLILREHESVIPHGDIDLRPEDHLIIVTEEGREDEVCDLIARDRDEQS
jgi:trk system potassium uptake protein TrkA